MRAYRHTSFTGFDALDLVDEDIPRPEAGQVLKELEGRSAQGQSVPFDIGLVWVGLARAGQSNARARDECLDWIEKACREQPSGVKDLGVDSRFDALRDAPRFRQILRRLGLG